MIRTKIDQIECFVSFSVSCVDVLTSTAPIPFVGIITSAIDAGTAHAIDMARCSQLEKVREKYGLLLKQLRAIEVLEGCSIQYFCKQLSLSIIEKCHTALSSIEATRIDVISRDLVKGVMEAAVGGIERGYGVFAPSSLLEGVKSKLGRSGGSDTSSGVLLETDSDIPVEVDSEVLLGGYASGNTIDKMADLAMEVLTNILCGQGEAAPASMADYP